MSQRVYYVYILTNVHRSVLYTGVTNDIEIRIMEHYANRGTKKSFTGRYNVFYLLYYEPHKYINNAIARETEIKKWSRKNKMKLIAEMNPGLDFLNEKVFGCWPPKEIITRGK
jgi:putative endonuclease